MDPESGDTPAPKSSPPGDAPPKSEPQKDPDKDFVPFGEYDKVLRAQNWAQSALKEERAKREELEAQVAELTKAQQKSSKNGQPDEALKNAEDRIKELTAERERLLGEVRTATVKSRVMSEAQKHIVDGALNQFWQLEGEKFDTVKDDTTGESKVVVKSKPWVTFDEYFSELAKESPWLVKSNRSPGGNVPNKPGESAPGQSNPDLPQGFDGWSYDQKYKYFSELKPEDRAKVASKLQL